jgi:ASTRA-associated protein 1
MAVSALNFCAFALCAAGRDFGEEDRASEASIAVPNALDSGGIDFFHLPSERRVSVLKADSKVKTGMVMAVDLFYNPATGLLTVISGYEDGHTMVHQRKSVTSSDEKWLWTKILIARPHSQPVLSLDTTLSRDFYFTSSADAVITEFSIPTSSLGGDCDAKPAKVNNTKHASQQDLTVRNDGKIFATAGWDARIRVYSTKTLKELAVLKWHQDGCYSLAFAEIFEPRADGAVDNEKENTIVVSANPNATALDIIKQQRSLKAQQTHWLAGGGKDGKISLWDIY